MDTAHPSKLVYHLLLILEVPSSLLSQIPAVPQRGPSEKGRRSLLFFYSKNREWLGILNHITSAAYDET